VTFTIEEVVGTLDQAILSGVVVAAALAAVIERGILGVHPVMEVSQAYGLDHASSLLFYALLGLVAAVVSVGFTDGLLKTRLWFRGLKSIPAWAHPGIGGFVTGVLAVLVLHFLGTSGVNGGGYETLGLALGGKLGLRVLVALCLAKLVATVLSYSSGGAGGIFAPALFVGAMLGGAVGNLDVFVLNHEQGQLGAFALVGMGAVFAGVVRAPITSVLIIFEMTGGYGLILPLMLANMTSYVIARSLRPTPIYEALLAQDGVILPHAEPRSEAHTPEALNLQAHSIMTPALSVASSTTLSELQQMLTTGVANAFVVEQPGKLYRVILRSQVCNLAQAGEAMLTAADVAESVPSVNVGAELGDVIAATRADDIKAVVVVSDTGDAIGVVSKVDLALLMLSRSSEQWARRNG
jgi:predicted transcriptional regulator